MDAAAIIAAISAVIKTAVDVGPTVIQTIEDAEPFAKQLFSLVEGNTITVDQLATLEANVDALAAQILAPLPEDQAPAT